MHAHMHTHMVLQQLRWHGFQHDTPHGLPAALIALRQAALQGSAEAWVRGGGGAVRAVTVL